MPAAFFTPVTHFHYSYFFTNFGIFRVKIWREWTYISWQIDIDIVLTWPMTHSFKETKNIFAIVVFWNCLNNLKPIKIVNLMFLPDWFCTLFTIHQLSWCCPKEDVCHLNLCQNWQNMSMIACDSMNFMKMKGWLNDNSIW